MRTKPVFQFFSPASESDIQEVEHLISRQLPEELRLWLTTAGFGQIDDTINMQRGCFAPVKDGELKGAFRFAEDELGNYYACAPDSTIAFFSRSEPAYAIIAPSFGLFLAELERRDFKVLEWVESVDLAPYSWP